MTNAARSCGVADGSVRTHGSWRPMIVSSVRSLTAAIDETEPATLKAFGCESSGSCIQARVSLRAYR